IVNPDIPNRGVTDTAGEDAMNALIAQGYDGFIREYDGELDEINAFFPTQIKSAEENVGTFDGSNHDIRYQVVKRGTLSAEEVDELVQSLRSVDSEEVLRGMNLSGLYDTLRRLSILNENAYKGYGWISNAMAKQNGKIYSLKNSLLLKLTDELIRRGEDVGYHDGVLYFRDRNTGIQYSYHTSTYLYSNDPYENFNYTNKSPKWDGVRRGFTMTKEQYAQARIRAQQTMDARKRVAKACSEDAAETMKRVLKNGGRRIRLLGKGVAYADVVSMIDHVMSGRNYNIYAEENVSDATIDLIASNAFGVKDYDTRKWFVGVVLDNMRKPLSEYRKEWMQPAGKVEKHTRTRLFLMLKILKPMQKFSCAKVMELFPTLC
ncbi:MAG: hypothetical protein PUI86_05600, partial [Bacteroidales bacterium]|nr:hypothetical protein [Bacteroidales bacterium]